jgi:hypothetical protein
LSQSGEPNRIRSAFEKGDAVRQQIDIEAAFGSLLTADNGNHGTKFHAAALTGMKSAFADMATAMINFQADRLLFHRSASHSGMGARWSTVSLLRHVAVNHQYKYDYH